ncbi:MAG: hypothetical protein KDJ98_14475 [Rhodobacteraceae bacterium]|nr:hypothetical protein [Paracoccaceae bacterium]
MVRFVSGLAALLFCVVAAPVLAQQSVPGDGIYSIAGDPELAAEHPYGTARGWTVLAGQTNAGFAYCAAETTAGGVSWRFGYDIGGQWQVALQSSWRGETEYGTFDVDGHTSGITGWGDGRWLILWPFLGEYDAIAQGNRLSLQLGTIRYQLALSGTAAAALKVRECMENHGVSPQAAAAPANARRAVAMPNLAVRGETLIGNCQTAFASYRCTATTLTPTAGYGDAMLVEDAFGTEPGFVVQTDRADRSQVWVSFDRASYTYLGFWSTDGTCREPVPSQDAQVIANLGHDTWRLCIR